MSVEQLVGRREPPDLSEWPVEYGDFKRLFWKYKGLLKEQERSAAFWGATNDNLRIAYERLDAQERELERAYGLNRKYLDNIQEGLLIIDDSFTILDQYSAYLTTLFRTQDIKQRNFVDFVHPDRPANAEKRQELARFLRILFRNGEATDEVLMGVNPLKETVLEVTDSSGQAHRITVSVRFTRIIEDGRVAHVIFIFEDRTELVRVQEELETEKSRREGEIESLSAILRAGPQTFLEFLDESYEVMDEIESRIDELGRPDVTDALFRKVHSLKGSAKYLELDAVATLANEVEGRLAAIRGAGESVAPTAIAALHGGVAELRTRLAATMELTARIQHFSQTAAKGRQERSRAALGSFFEALTRMTQRLGSEVGKSVALTAASTVSELPFLGEIRSAVIHLVRNAIDHGVEDEFERVSLRKPPGGNIKVSVSSDGRDYLIDVGDDGRGIDFGRVRARAQEKGLVAAGQPVDQAALARLLFSPDFSCGDGTALSGRGYGLDIVREAVVRLGGRVSVATKKGVGTRFRIRVPAQGGATVPAGRAGAAGRTGAAAAPGRGGQHL